MGIIQVGAVNPKEVTVGCDVRTEPVEEEAKDEQGQEQVEEAPVETPAEAVAADADGGRVEEPEVAKAPQRVSKKAKSRKK